MTAERNEWYDLKKEVTKKLKETEVDLALQSTLWETALEDLHTHAAKIAELQEQLSAKSAELSQQ